MRSRKLLATLIAALAPLLMACPSSMGEDAGVTCIDDTGENLLASTASGRFSSTDGGTTWQREDNGGYNSVCANPGVITAGALEYRFRRGEAIDVRPHSSPEAWRVDHDLTFLYREARVSLLRSQAHAAANYEPVVKVGPFGGAHDVTSGNVVAAMGQDGVLVKTAGEWQWSNVGPYGFTGKSRFAVYESGWLLIMFAVALYLLAPLTAYGMASGPWFRRSGDIGFFRALLIHFLLASAWAWWVFVALGGFTASYPLSAGNTGAGLFWIAAFILSIPVLLLVAVPLTFAWHGRGIEQDRRFKHIVGAVAVALPTILVVLWLEGLIDRVILAQLVAASLVVTVLGGVAYLVLKLEYVPPERDPFERGLPPPPRRSGVVEGAPEQRVYPPTLRAQIAQLRHHDRQGGDGRGLGAKDALAEGDGDRTG